MEAMVELALSEPDLEVWATTSPEPFTIRAQLQSSTGHVVLLRISCGTSCIQMWPDRMKTGDPVERRSIPLKMSHDYEWAGLRFPTASVFARVLVQRMRDELPTDTKTVTP